MFSPEMEVSIAYLRADHKLNTEAVKSFIGSPDLLRILMLLTDPSPVRERMGRTYLDTAMMSIYEGMVNSEADDALAGDE